MAVRKISDEFSRVHNVIQADKSVMSEACKALALKDFANKFDEYFDLVQDQEQAPSLIHSLDI